MDDDRLLVELAPAVERLLDRHLATAKEWFPHELVPWSRGRDFADGYEWSEDEASISAPVRSALFVNLLTEDNLPYYFQSIDRMFSSDGPWGVWARRWTAEEGRHAIVIRDYLTVTRALDPVALERARMTQVAGGITPQPATVADGLVYVALQELATRIAHRNTGKLLEDRWGYDVMARVAADENRHHLFYRDLVTTALAVDPDSVVPAIDRQVRGFAMPGVGIPDFTAHAAAIARAGIYNFAIHHDHVLVPVVLHQWQVDQLESLGDEAEAARESVLRHIQRVGAVGRRQEARRDEEQAATVSA